MADEKKADTEAKIENKAVDKGVPAPAAVQPAPADGGSRAPAEQADTSDVSKAEQDAIDKALGDHSEADDDHIPEKFQRAKEAADKITRLVNGIPADTSDDFILYGAAGVTITLGDFRALVPVFAG